MRNFFKTKPIFILILFFVYSTNAALPQFSGSEKIPTLAPILKKATPAIVNISIIPKRSEATNPLFEDPFFNKFFKDFHQFKQFNYEENDSYNKQQSIGSGVIIDSQKGHIITNYHVIKNAKEVFVTLKDKRQLRAKIVGTDDATDLALLKIDAKDIESLPISNSDDLEVGDYVIAIGHPFSLSHTVTSGIVSGLSRSGLGIEGYEDFIQTDASINPGNSGGALINLKGELVGINTVILSAGGIGNIGIGFAIPSNIVKMVTQNLIKFGEVKRGQIGIYAQNITPELAKAFDLSINNGAIISKVNKNSPAEKAGLMEGDVITKVNDKIVNNISDVRNMIGMQSINIKVKIDFLRGKDSKTTEVTVGPQTKDTTSSDSLNISLLDGANFADMTSAHPLYEKVQGVLVTKVKPGSSAWGAGLREKDIIVSVNKEKVTNIAELKKAVALKKNGILLNVRRGNAALYIIIH